MENCIHGKNIAGFCEACAQPERVLYVKGREIYGVKRLYLQGPEAVHVKALTGRETLTPADIQALKGLGYIVKEQAQEVTL